MSREAAVGLTEQLVLATTDFESMEGDSGVQPNLQMKLGASTLLVRSCFAGQLNSTGVSSKSPGQSPQTFSEEDLLAPRVVKSMKTVETAAEPAEVAVGVG
jgi:hypothetical protein